MKKALIVIGLALLLAAGLAAASYAAKPPAPPGQGECAHGNSGKPCKEDPQPEKGKDCEEHGNKGGVNEDHCKGSDTTTTDTTDTTETTTTTEVTTSTNPTTPTETSPTETTPGSEPGTPTTPDSGKPSKPPVTPEELEKELEEQASNNAPTAPGTSAGRPQSADELPYTGIPLLPVALLGSGLTALGLGLRRKT